jgi:hypothetical protein
MGKPSLGDVPCYEKELQDPDVMEISEAKLNELYKNAAPKADIIE